MYYHILCTIINEEKSNLIRKLFSLFYRQLYLKKKKNAKNKNVTDFLTLIIIITCSQIVLTHIFSQETGVTPLRKLVTIAIRPQQTVK